MSINARYKAGHPGAPLEPTGDPLADGIGPAAWAVDRADRPDLTLHGEPKIQPMKAVSGYSVAAGDLDPRGCAVVAGDGVAVGTVVDIWVDRSEPQVRYLETELSGGGGTRLVPMGYVRVRKAARELHVKSIYSKHFPGIPTTKAADRITLLEEDRVVAYFAGGYLYADPARMGPVL